MAGRGHVIRVGSPPRGLKCCCCVCCACLDLGYLKTRHGLTKILEAVLGSFCQSMLVKYGLSQAGAMGSAFHGFLTTVAACVLTTTLLIVCYVCSPKSQNLIRQSLFEFLFNASSCFLYLSAASCLAASVHFYLYPQYITLPMYSAYPAMTAVYYIGAILGILHGVDAYSAFRYYKGYR